METPYDWLRVGLHDHFKKKHPDCKEPLFITHYALLNMASMLIEGDALSKKWARKELKKYIANGRCILQEAMKRNGYAINSAINENPDISVETGE